MGSSPTALTTPPNYPSNQDRYFQSKRENLLNAAERS